jgi:hypothetical protein
MSGGQVKKFKYYCGETLHFADTFIPFKDLSQSWCPRFCASFKKLWSYYTKMNSLSLCRPAYMDEYELLRKELNELFLVYVEKSRNLQWLESQREIYIREEQEKLEEVNRKMRRLQRRVQNEVNYHLTISLCMAIKCNNHSIICHINSPNSL